MRGEGEGESEGGGEGEGEGESCASLARGKPTIARLGHETARGYLPPGHHAYASHTVG